MARSFPCPLRLEKEGVPMVTLLLRQGGQGKWQEVKRMTMATNLAWSHPSFLKRTKARGHGQHRHSSEEGKVGDE